MQLGDFSELASNYRHRPGYSLDVLSLLLKHVAPTTPGPDFTFADVGAGTGKLTECLLQMGLKGVAVEPNDSMREEGARTLSDESRLKWSKGSAEETGLPDASADWLFMASSFHWAQTELALKEFSRVLKPGGCFTVIYNPRDIRSNEFQKSIDDGIRAMVPELKRNSSGASKYTEDLEAKLVSTGEFTNPIFVEAPYEIPMSRERYIGVWKSVNDIQAQAGPERWAGILQFLEDRTKELEVIPCSYRIRAWTVRKALGGRA